MGSPPTGLRRAGSRSSSPRGLRAPVRAAMTSPRPPVTTVQPRSASSLPTSSAASSPPRRCRITDTWTATVVSMTAWSDGRHAAGRSSSEGVRREPTSPASSGSAARRSSRPRTSCRTRRSSPRRAPARSSRATSSSRSARCARTPSSCSAGSDALDASAEVVLADTLAGRLEIAYEHLVVALGAVTRSLPVPGLAEHGLGFKDLADAIALRNRVLQQLERASIDPARARGARLRLRRRRVRGGRGARRAERPRPRRPRFYPRSAACRSAGCSSTPRRRSSRRSRAPRRVRGAPPREARRRDPRRNTTLESYDGREAVLSDGRAIPTRTLVWRAGVRATRSSRSSGCRSTSGGGWSSTRRSASRARSGLGARRLRRGAELADAGRPRPADLPARAAPGAPAREEPHGSAAAVRLPHARPGRDARPLQGHRRRLPGCSFRGFLGWFVARTYHLYQLPCSPGSCASSLDWTVALFFPRDIVELSVPRPSASAWAVDSRGAQAWRGGHDRPPTRSRSRMHRLLRRGHPASLGPRTSCSRERIPGRGAAAEAERVNRSGAGVAASSNAQVRWTRGCPRLVDLLDPTCTRPW